MTDRLYASDPDSPDVCMVCGNHQHRHADGTCPQTIDSLTDDQILAWAECGPLDVAIDASPRLRARLRGIGILGIQTPTRDAEDAARQRIVDELNNQG